MEIIDVTQPVNVGWLICDGLAPKSSVHLVLMFCQSIEDRYLLPMNSFVRIHFHFGAKVELMEEAVEEVPKKMVSLLWNKFRAASIIGQAEMEQLHKV